MRRCAFLTMPDPSGYAIDDDLAHEPLRALGWEVENVPWSRPDIAWDRYDGVVIRSTWDYQASPERFLSVLETIERAGCRLENSLETVRWNLRKTYLRELAKRGVPTVPTLWLERLAPGGLERVFEEVGAREMVVKPVVSASAEGAFRLDRATIHERATAVESTFVERPLMAQPFVRSIVNEGEYSLVYFDGRLSHTVLKTPKVGDFRVQEEHGGDLEVVVASGPLLAAGGAVLAALDRVPLYARVDLARSEDRRSFWLVELELIEPALFFHCDSRAPGRFAEAFARRW